MLSSSQIKGLENNWYVTEGKKPTLYRHRHIFLYTYTGRRYWLSFSELQLQTPSYFTIPQGVVREAGELRTQLRGRSAKEKTKEFRSSPPGGDGDQTPGETRRRHRVEKDQKIVPPV